MWIHCISLCCKQLILIGLVWMLCRAFTEQSTNDSAWREMEVIYNVIYKWFIVYKVYQINVNLFLNTANNVDTTVTEQIGMQAMNVSDIRDEREMKQLSSANIGYIILKKSWQMRRKIEKPGLEEIQASSKKKKGRQIRRRWFNWTWTDTTRNTTKV